MVPSPHPTCGCPRGKSWNRRHQRSYVFHRHRCTRLCCYALQRCQRIQLSCFRTQRCRTGIEKWTTNQLKARHFDGKNLAFVELMLGFLMKCPQFHEAFVRSAQDPGSCDGSDGSHGRSSLHNPHTPRSQGFNRSYEGYRFIPKRERGIINHRLAETPKIKGSWNKPTMMIVLLLQVFLNLLEDHGRSQLFVSLPKTSKPYSISTTNQDTTFFNPGDGEHLVQPYTSTNQKSQ